MLANGIDHSQAQSETPVLDRHWKDMGDEERNRLLRPIVAQSSGGLVRLKEARASGIVIVELNMPLSAARRGQVLLDIEEALRNALHQPWEVYLRPAQDKNALRHLRGVRVQDSP